MEAKTSSIQKAIQIPSKRRHKSAKSQTIAAKSKYRHLNLGKNTILLPTEAASPAKPLETTSQSPKPQVPNSNMTPEIEREPALPSSHKPQLPTKIPKSAFSNPKPKPTKARSGKRLRHRNDLAHPQTKKKSQERRSRVKAEASVASRAELG